MKHRILLAAALIAATPFAASAQFTAVITPPKKEQPTVVAQAQTPAARDSVQKVKLTDMKEWVDSAASALTAKGPSAADTAAVKTTRTPVPVVTQQHHQVASTKSAELPDTASPLPFVALLGFGMLATGLFLLRKRA